MQGVKLPALLLLAVAPLAANAGDAWLACTPIDDPINGRRVFQQEPCPPGEAHIPLPTASPAQLLRDTFPEPSTAYGADSWPVTAGGGSAGGYSHARHYRHGYSGRTWRYAR